MAWHQKSRSNFEERMKMGLVKWEAGKEQAAMSLCTSLLLICDAKHFDGNKGLDRKCNQWQEGEIALEMVW